jgi:hypothetical protein
MPAVFPVAYFGNIDYFRKLIASENTIIETKEHFIKQTVRSRCTILSANGPLVLSIPIERKNGSKTSMDDAVLSTETDWRKIHWKAIESAYSSSPFFDYYGPEVHDLIYQTESSLVRLNAAITERIFEWLDLDKKLTFSSDYISPKEALDFRNDEFDDCSDIRPYTQVFSPSNQFEPNMSILDLIFCEGPLARRWIISSQKIN